jgi:PAS domain S-box-containing protein
MPPRLTDLITREKLDGLLRVFTSVTDVAAIIAHIDGSPITQQHNFSQICSRYCRSTAEGSRRCRESDRYGGLTSARLRKPHIYDCLNAGLIDCAAPIIVEGYHLATILCGQVLEKPLESSVAIHRAKTIGINDIDGYLQELQKIPIMSRGRLVSIINLMAEITQTVSELALQKHLLQKHSQHYLSRLINSVSDCIVSMDGKNTISMINAAGAKMFGYPLENLIGQSVLALLADGHSKMAYEKQSFSRSRDNFRMDLIGGKADGSVFPVQLSMSGISDENGNLAGYVGVIRDVSEEKKINRLKEDLIGMITHDLRNPILSIQKAILLLIDGPLGPLTQGQSEVLHLVYGTTQQMYGMVSDLLDIYRNENDQFYLYRAPMDMKQAIQESVEQLDFISKDKQISVVADGIQEPLRLNGDQNRLVRTLVNLLDNALRYSSEGSTIVIHSHLVNGNGDQGLLASMPREEACRYQFGKSYILTTISDQGIGIPEQYRRFVFDKFFKIKTTDPGGRKSMGLGLAFCKQVVEAHNGSIWVNSNISSDESPESRGCRFSFLLPVN